MTDSRVGTTDDGRTIIWKYKGEEPKSARANKRYLQLWKFARELECCDIQILISKRRNELKYEGCPDNIRILRTEILILEDAYRIKKRK